MNVNIVLDLGYGDSGKGKTVDYLCSQYEQPLVVRFSGGQQCGHTVMNEKGKHVHASYPSGTLSGHYGYISEHCTVSPTHMKNEWDYLTDFNTPKLIVHPLAPVTTPYDIALNRIKEIIRGHGSCGMGVGETMHRHHNTPYKLHVIDLKNKWVLKKKMRALVEYYQEQIRSIDFEKFYDVIKKPFNYEFKPEEVMSFFKNVEWFLDNVIIQGYDFIDSFEDVIFEGSQGIMLDMDHGIFPHVTYANTTSKNVWGILETRQVDSIETYYVTRCYSTRHGNGPLLDEDEKFKIKLKNKSFEINKFNEWQGHLRYAPLNEDLLNFALDCDLVYNKGIRSVLCINHLDQMHFELDNFGFRHRFHDVLASGTPKSIYTKL